MQPLFAETATVEIYIVVYSAKKKRGENLCKQRAASIKIPVKENSNMLTGKIVIEADKTLSI